MIFQLAAVIARHLVRGLAARLEGFEIGFEAGDQPVEIGLRLPPLILSAHFVHPRLVDPLGRLRALGDPARELRVAARKGRSEEHTSELQSLMRISYAVFCLKKKNTHKSSKLYNQLDIQ